MFMLRQTYVKMAVLLHKQANDWFHPLLTVPGHLWNSPNQILIGFDALKFCKTPMKFETKVAHLDICVLPLPDR